MPTPCPSPAAHDSCPSGSVRSLGLARLRGPSCTFQGARRCAAAALTRRPTARRSPTPTQTSVVVVLFDATSGRLVSLDHQDARPSVRAASGGCPFRGGPSIQPFCRRCDSPGRARPPEHRIGWDAAPQPGSARDAGEQDPRAAGRRRTRGRDRNSGDWVKRLGRVGARHAVADAVHVEDPRGVRGVVPELGPQSA